MEIIEMLIAPIATIAGLLVGSLSTYFSQSRMKEKELIRENEKEKQKILLDCLDVYNQILKLDGENILVSHLGGMFDSFKIETYKEKIRPILYSKFHLLNKDVADSVREMDNLIAEASYYEEFIDGQEQYLVSLYHKMIKAIEKHLESFRDTHI